MRYHVIDMRGFMDISYCIPVRKASPDNGNIKADVVPAGRYASLIYSGGGISGNRALIEWVRAQGIDFDRWDTEEGDNFRGRYETFLTDPKIEPRKSKWQIKVAIKVADK
ncbi:GyrI-like domain-containing protein [Candidatus Villigracilis affinis]|uniref:GyrI-like domain-containing protein n=1 Tax=Candidatus Villigracilis affinis TaxID=3140682 RepID=UPI001D66B63A|nr:GyrI-like domain-containing protein [Anaerolineales bacterium]